MIVLDASAAVDWLLQTPPAQRIETRIFHRNESLHAPHLLDLEVAQVLRRLVLQGTIAANRAEQAIGDLRDLRLHRYPALPFLARIWRLRHNFSAYDAAYAVLAEVLGATLITRDERLASAARRVAKVELF